MFRIRTAIVVLAFVGGLAGLPACSPSEEAAAPEAAPPPDGASETAPPADEQPESAETTEDTANAGAGIETVEAEDAAPAEEPTGSATASEDVDTSIREAAPFGDDALLEGLTPEGYEQSGDIEHYNVASLYDKIDGRSELYMAYDVVGLSWVSYVSEDDPNDFIDVFAYDMRSPTTAFGIFSVEREMGEPKVDLGREGYRSDSNLYFWKGKYYAYIQTSKDTEQSADAAMSIAKGLLERIDDSGESIKGLEHLPKEGLIEDSVQFFRADAMSLDFMTNTFIGRYGTPEDYITAFLSTRESEADAADIVAKYKGYLENYGDNVATTEVDGVTVTLGDLGGGFHDAVFHIGNTVAGVSAIEGREATIEAVKSTIDRIQNR